MLRKFFQDLLRKPVSRLAARYDSRPVKSKVHGSLSRLFRQLLKNTGKKGPVIQFGTGQRFIILSDQHKGAKNGSDDFAGCEQNYLAALDYYYQNTFTYINLGDSEELWKNNVLEVIKHNGASFEKEKLFLKDDRFVKIFGNHDLYWDNDPLASIGLYSIYGQKIKIHEGAILQTTSKEKQITIFLTHGHQGDLQSDGNWFSKWFVSIIWAPLQSYLGLNLNTPANDDSLKSDHNRFMYEWSTRQKDTILITGHTHQPVFMSLTHLERLYHALNKAKLTNDEVLIKTLEEQIKNRYREGDVIPDFTAYKPGYFNSGCCCFNDGDITGIEIEDGFIRLIKWEYNSEGVTVRMVLEETSLELLADLI